MGGGVVRQGRGAACLGRGYLGQGGGGRSSIMCDGIHARGRKPSNCIYTQVGDRWCARCDTVTAMCLWRRYSYCRQRATISAGCLNPYPAPLPIPSWYESIP